jgi:hypothetical protein
MLGWKYVKFDPASYVLLFSKGTLKREGVGLAGFCYAPTTSIVKVPTTSDDVSYIFEETTSDFQLVTVQGRLTYRVVDPKKLSAALNFAVNLKTLQYESEDPVKISQRLVGAVKQITQRNIGLLSLRDALRSNDQLTQAIDSGMKEMPELLAMGIAVAGVSVEAVKPKPDTAKALEAETREHILKSADEAVFLRRNAAVEQERKIKENELETEIAVENKKRSVREAQMDAELSIQQRKFEMRQEEMLAKVEIERKNLELVDLAVANKKKEVEIKILELNETMRAIGSINPQVIQALAMSKVGSSELIAMAFGDLAKSAERIGTLNITPDLLSTLVDAPKRK